jgi:hypothetical protein
MFPVCVSGFCKRVILSHSPYECRGRQLKDW